MFKLQYKGKGRRFHEEEVDNQLFAPVSPQKTFELEEEEGGIKIPLFLYEMFNTKNHGLIMMQFTQVLRAYRDVILSLSPLPLSCTMDGKQ